MSNIKAVKDKTNTQSKPKKVYDVNVVSVNIEGPSKLSLLITIVGVLFLFVFLNWQEFVNRLCLGENFNSILSDKLWQLLSVTGVGFVYFIANSIVFSKKKDKIKVVKKNGKE